jgi:phosphoserine/homoserine phosphotransferase
MYIVCSDLEGVFTPEIWINVAEKTGIPELRLTTRDISDYDVLMKKRLLLLKENGLTLKDIQAVISTIEPLEGAREFLNWLRSRTQVIIVSDTFTQFAGPLMEKLGRPTLFCHELVVGADASITDYRLRQTHAKQKTITALQNLNYRVIAVGDSYNDIDMLKEAYTGLLYNPPDNVIAEFPEFTISNSYMELKHRIQQIIGNEPDG